MKQELFTKSWENLQNEFRVRKMKYLVSSPTTSAYKKHCRIYVYCSSSSLFLWMAHSGGGSSSSEAALGLKGTFQPGQTHSGLAAWLRNMGHRLTLGGPCQSQPSVALQHTWKWMNKVNVPTTRKQACLKGHVHETWFISKIACSLWVDCVFIQL